MQTFKIFPPDRSTAIWMRVRTLGWRTQEREKRRRNWKMMRFQWTLRESYKVNKLLFRETRRHLKFQLSLLSQSMKDVLISIPITSLRFISITQGHSLELANCSAKQYQWHFKGSSVWWYSNVVRFWGISQLSFEVRQQWQNATRPAHHRHEHAAALFLQDVGSGLTESLCTTWIRFTKIPHWWLTRRWRWIGVQLYPQAFSHGVCERQLFQRLNHQGQHFSSAKGFWDKVF